MPSIQQQREKVVELLQQLFQLDQPDLDFGFYRIMHAKAAQVSAFLENDLLKIVEQTFGQAGAEKVAAAQKAYDDAVAQARSFGAPDPEATEPVKKARAALDAAKDTSRAEGEVYDHLYRFFERYYEGGDFLSRRYYARETAGKAAPYAVPYDGSEVYLHWANKDQYYIKTSEYFTNFTFDLAKAPEVQAAAATLFTGGRPHSLRVHFRIVAATEGEHGNVKASEATRRYFILHAADPVGFENGELVCRFEYRPDPEKTGQDARWQATRNEQAVTGILEALSKLTDAAAREYLGALKTPAPTEKQKDRPLLARYVNRYTARNTTDYFIHKDLRSFLKRELDFYIKNEVMRLDDIESADAPAVESYLEQVRCLRKIAGRIIDFLAQLEDFQKKLWLKKKFVVETRWCVTIGTILAIEDAKLCDALLDAIVGCEPQWQEWESLHHLSELKGIGGDSGGLFDQKLKLPSVEFLKAHTSLMIDTRHFKTDTLELMLAGLGLAPNKEYNDGILVHAENSQALATLRQEFSQAVNCAYIDPNYNTEKADFIYKDGYKRSTWLCMIGSRLTAAKPLLADFALLYCSIDEHETARLREAGEQVFGGNCFVAELIWNTQHSQQSGLFTPYHEYVQVFGTRPAHEFANFGGGTGEIVAGAMKKISRGNPASDFEFPAGTPWYAPDGTELKGRWGGTETVELVKGRMLCENNKLKYSVVLRAGWTQKRQMEAFFAGNRPVLDSKNQEVTGFFFNSTGKLKITKKREKITPNTLLPQFGTTSQATAALADFFGTEVFGRPKPVAMIQYLVSLPSADDTSSMILDFFAGSGTTGHAVINLNREDGGRRKFILVEMGDYFETVLLPRLKKVTFTPEWKDGRPKRLPTAEEVERGPRIFKVLRLESYEDALNNLELKDDPDRRRLLEQNPGLRTDYMLHYMLDVETRGSASLLNIDQFKDPTAYRLKVKKPGSDEYEWKNVDLIETFNYLIGLRVEHYAAPQTFAAEFERETDPDLPKGQLGRLKIKGKLKQATEEKGGKWWFRQVEGWVPKNPATPNDGQREKVLVVWRKLAASIEKGPEGLEYDNAVLDEWFRKHQINPRESYDYDVIYVNGSNNLPNLRLENENWRVRLIEEDFHRLMWESDEA